MRVTNSLMSKSYLRNLNRQTTKLQKYQDQLSSLKEVSRPSDDPLTVSKILDLNNSITLNEKYQDTIDDAIDWTNVQDAALGQASNSLARIRTLIQSAANGTMSSDDRKAVKNNIEGEIGSLMDALNTNFGGRYVFSGQNTTTKPFTYSIDESGIVIQYHDPENKNEENLPREVSPGVTVDLLTNGNKLVNIDGEELDQFFNDVFDALDKGDQESLDALGGSLLEKADKAFENVVNFRTEVGATFNRLESAKERNETENLSLQNMRSNKQDVDLAEKYMEYTMEMVAYQSTLQMGTKILQTNILNYL